MKFLLRTLLIVCFFGAVALSANATQDRIALVTIRFNQQVVVYQDQLYNAVVEAVKLKPSVAFTVVGTAPTDNDPAKAQKLLENTQYYTQKVTDDLLKIGVNPAQVRSNVQTSPNVKDEEVKIFVN